MTEKLRTESLKGYSSGVKDPIYAEAIKTLDLLQNAFTQRSHGQGRGALVPLHLVQAVCSLGITGFEDAGSFQEYKKCIPSNLEEIWLLFATTLIHYVRDQNISNNEPIFFGCFEIPNWFVIDSQTLPVFKYFE